MPNSGDLFSVVNDEDKAKTLTEARQRINRQNIGSQSTANILAQASGLVEGNFETRHTLKIPIVLKADVSDGIHRDSC